MKQDKISDTRHEPKLRFYGFNLEYETVKLTDVLQLITQKNKDNESYNILTNSALWGVIFQADYFTKNLAASCNYKVYKIVNIGDFVYNPRKSLHAPYGPFNRSTLKGIISPLYMVFKDKKYCDAVYLDYYLKSTALHKSIYRIANYGARHDRMNFKSTDFLHMELKLPQDRLEQSKIAAFHHLIDQKITLLDQKIKELKRFNKKLIDNLISNQATQKYQLGTIGYTLSGLTGKAKDDFGSGERFVNYLNVFNHHFVNIDECEKVRVSTNEKQNKLLFGDVIFTISSENPQEIGMSSIFTHKGQERIYLNSFCFIFRLNDFKTLTPFFAAYYFRSTTFRKKMYTLAQGISRYNLSKVSFLRQMIQIPSLEAQNKLSTIFFCNHSKVKLLEKKLENFKRFKKGLLQQMFI